MATPPKTTLTAFFLLCQNDAFAKTLLYVEEPRYYTWNVSLKEWKRCVQGTPVNGWPGAHAEKLLENGKGYLDTDQEGEIASETSVYNSIDSHVIGRHNDLIRGFPELFGVIWGAIT
ncbi:uncharacterized protein TNCV_4794161 [Trichonephila clavipes]|nr:uncharacterized protein TNCV_4794161 [Trichonephila clavipes]